MNELSYRGEIGLIIKVLKSTFHTFSFQDDRGPGVTHGAHQRSEKKSKIGFSWKKCIKGVKSADFLPYLIESYERGHNYLF